MLSLATAALSLALAFPSRATEPVAADADSAHIGLVAATHTAVFLAAAQAVTPLTLPMAASVLAPSPFVASLIHDEARVSTDNPGFAVRNHAPESWFVDSIVCGMKDGLSEQSDRLFTRDAVLEGPRFFAREERFDFTPRRDVEQIVEDRQDDDRRLFVRTGLEAVRGTVVQSDVYYHVFRHVSDIDFHLFFTPGTDPDGSRGIQVLERKRSASSSTDALTRLDVKFKPSRVLDDREKLVEIEGWIFDLVEFSVYPMNAEARLRVPLYSRKSLSVDLVTEFEGPDREGAVFVSVQSRF